MIEIKIPVWKVMVMTVAALAAEISILVLLQEHATNPMILALFVVLGIVIILGVLLKLTIWEWSKFVLSLIAAELIAYRIIEYLQ